MKFGLVALDQAAGAVLAHTVRWEKGVLRKGAVLDAERIETLRAAGIAEIWAARPEIGDLTENEAATRIAATLVPAPARQGIAIAQAVAGRVNLFAEFSGLFRVQSETITRLNSGSEAITAATLPDFTRVRPRQITATIKIIPYAVSDAEVEKNVRILSNASPAVEVRPVTAQSAALICTHRQGSPTARPDKGEQAVRARLKALGVPLMAVKTVPHEIGPLALEISTSNADIVLVLGDTATADRQDVVPAAILAAGGEVLRFGMPVDPGNLLLFASLDSRHILALPGCVRSPKLNGADWVLERLACGLKVTVNDIASMGVGGLLHEIPLRPQPRIGGTRRPKRPMVSVLLLAAGLSRRMGGPNKLLKKAGSLPLAVRAAKTLAASQPNEILVVTGADAEQVEASLRKDGPSDLRFVRNPAYGEGIGSSVRIGMTALSPEADVVLIALADMPNVQTEQVNRLIDAYDPEAGRSICRTTDPEGRPGHPILFGRRFFEILAELSGDRGARDIIAEYASELVDLPVSSKDAITDLDTLEDWRQWQQKTIRNR